MIMSIKQRKIQIEPKNKIELQHMQSGLGFLFTQDKILVQKFVNKTNSKDKYNVHVPITS